MSTTVELVRANERYARLRAAVEGLAAEWEADARALMADDNAGSLMSYVNCTLMDARDLRALLAAVDS